MPNPVGQSANGMRALPFVLWLLILQSLTVLAADQRPPAFKNVGPDEFDKLRADPKNVVLDVRTKKEFDSGHIPGAINIDWNGPDFAKKAAELDKSKTYLVHCAAGVRSVKACNLMAGKIGLTNSYNLVEGFKSWEKAGKPVQK